MDLLIRGFSIYAFAAATAILALGLAIPRRKSPGGRWLVFYLLIHTLWMGINALVYAGYSLEARLLLLSIASISSLAPVSMFLFAVEYANPSFRVGNGILVPLALIPALGIAAAVTNPLHNLYIKSASLDVATGIHIIQYGPVFESLAYLGVALAFVTASILALTAVRSSGAVRNQSALIILGIVAMGVAYLYVLSLPERPLGVDPAMAGAAMGVIVSIAISNSRLLSLSPVGRAEVFDMLPEGFIITDMAGTVVDANPSAIRLVAYAPNRSLFGVQVGDIFSGWLCAGNPCHPSQFDGVITALDPVADALPLGVQRWRLRDSTGQEIGDAYVVRDNSGNYWTKSQLAEIQQSLASWSEEMHELEHLLKRFG